MGRVVAAYNDAWKAQGGKGLITFDSVKKANPKINLDRVQIGQEIFIPLPAVAGHSNEESTTSRSPPPGKQPLMKKKIRWIFVFRRGCTSTSAVSSRPCSCSTSSPDGIRP